MSVSVLFYVQHLLGIGHLARVSLIAEALVSAGARVTMVSGGRPIAGFPSDRVDLVQLPALSAGPSGFSDLRDENGNPASDELKRDRRDTLIGLLNDRSPDVVLIEAYPFGRRQMRFEIDPLLTSVASMTPRPLVACSVRDISAGAIT